MADSWFYAKAGNRMGPVTLEQLKGMLAQGVVMPGDMVWRDGMAQWAPAASMPELGGQPLPPPTPAPYVPPVPSVPMSMRAEPWSSTQRTFRIMLIVAAGVTFLTFFSPQFYRLSSSSGVDQFGQAISGDWGDYAGVPRLAWGWHTWFGITIFIVSIFAIAAAIIDLALRKIKMIPAIMQWVHLGLFGMMAVMSLLGTILGIFGIGVTAGLFYCIPLTAFLTLLALAMGVTISLMLVTKHRSRA